MMEGGPKSSAPPPRTQPTQGVVVESPKKEGRPIALEAVVLHPGSHSLKLGLAIDDLPFVVPHLIARRVTELPAAEGAAGAREGRAAPAAQQFIANGGGGESDQRRAVLEKRRRAGLDTVMKEEVPLKRKSLVEDVERLNAHNCTEAVTWADDFVWADVSHRPPFLVGADAQRVSAGSGYRLQRPIVRGRFNVQQGYTMRMVLDDLRTIWEHALMNELSLALSPRERNFSQYLAVLIVADLFDRREVREMINMLVHEMGFAGIMVIQESVCAAFGYGLASACVVDIGDQKTSVTCVDEGACIPDSRFVLDYGGRDIADWLLWLMKNWGKHHFPYTAASVMNPLDEMFLHELKKECCHLHKDEQTTQIFSFYERHAGQRTLLHRININQELIFAPLGLFYPAVLSLPAERVSSVLAPLDGAIIDDDIFPETPKSQSRPKNVQESSPAKSAAGRSDSAMAGELTTLSEMMALHEAVVASIGSIPANRKEQRKRVCSAIILAGGSSQFPGLRELLEAKANTAVPESWMQETSGNDGTMSGGKVEVLANRRKDMELDSRFLSWKGGAIVACLDTTREFWISAVQWRVHGERHLRERGLFPW